MLEPAKKLDQELMYEIGELIKVLVRIDKTEALDLAESLGEDYLKLQQKIKTHDYSKENEILCRVYWSNKSIKCMNKFQTTREKKLAKYGNGTCVYCGSTKELTLDHVIPQALTRILGQEKNADQENIIVLCRECNNKKGHMLKTNDPLTANLLKKHVDRWLWANASQRQKRQYVFRNLPVKHDTTVYHFVSQKKYLENIYHKQTGTLSTA